MIDTLIPPHHEAAERSLIYDLLHMHPQALDIIAKITPDDIYSPGLRTIYTRMHTAAIEGEYTTVCMHLIRSEGVTAPDQRFPVWAAADVILDLAGKRRLIVAVQEVGITLSDDTITATEANLRAEALISAAIDNRTGNMPPAFAEGIDQTEMSMAGSSIAWRTGIISIDHRVQVTRDSFVIIGARPAQGKTALALSMWMNNACQGTFGAFASMEMSREQIIRRMVSMVSCVSYSDILKGWKHMGEERSESVKSALKLIRSFAQNGHDRMLWASKRLTIPQLRAWLKHVRPPFCMVDYIQLIKPVKSRSDRVAELEEIIFSLRDLAQELEIPIIGLAQLNRDASGAEPCMEHLKGSSAFEQAGTEILFLDRPEAEERPKMPERRYTFDDGSKAELFCEGERTNLAAIKIIKNRNGMPGYRIVKFIPDRMWFGHHEESR